MIKLTQVEYNIDVKIEYRCRFCRCYFLIKQFIKDKYCKIDKLINWKHTLQNTFKLLPKTVFAWFVIVNIVFDIQEKIFATNLSSLQMWMILFFENKILIKEIVLFTNAIIQLKNYTY